MAGIDDLMTDAQDAFFADDSVAATRLCARVLGLKRNEGDAYHLAHLALHSLRLHNAAMTVAQEWGVHCNESAKQLYAELVSAYLAGNSAVVEYAARALVRREDASVISKSVAIALAADLHHAVGSAETIRGFKTEDLPSDVLHFMDLLAAWTELSVGKAEAGLAELQSLATSHPTSGVATALLAVVLYELDQRAAAQELIAHNTTDTMSTRVARLIVNATTAPSGDVSAAHDDLGMLNGVPDLLTRRLDQSVRGDAPDTHNLAALFPRVPLAPVSRGPAEDTLR
ncbi:hypothetical protein CAOG_02907 [Capsaspora owczarzaki ATCC 30864]|uniref:Uncharacterized protein n=1 Tax=Capsaspora owczarzaki (strain ATCC 30864) TaxID=595528 RepID=A0A0D2VND9_CAPO3|nr:hypothetical protein CAOG_02907 [Capsaspora owczarzaki ATCC 30864]KJE91827.1 hypothetical protein CAOG_002907 [Capsaspora owczarzaki ATCC 30864]|eukprot:XP_004363746.1 hypothetical protein CAOG_02907 [Capsaspora owczarzaki ATCC 30864]